MRTWFTHNGIWAGWMAAWLYIASLVLFQGSRILFSVGQREFPETVIAPIESLVSGVLYLAFLNGIRAFAISRNDMDMTRTVNSLLAICAFMIVLMYPFSLSTYVDANFLPFLLVALVPVLCVIGVFQLRLSEHFIKYAEELGTLGKRLVLWNKIAGWMFASVVFIIPGLLVSLVADFYLWRLLARASKK